jgi:transposase
MQCEEDWLVMHVLHTKYGWSIEQIAREFKVNWRTAKRYATAEDVPRYPDRPAPAGLTPAQLAHVTRRLDVCPELRVTTLYRELVDLEYSGSYPSLVRHVRPLRPDRSEIDPSVRFETHPGKQAQGDWAHCGRWMVGGDLVELHAWVMVLGYSRMVAVRFATETTRATTLSLVLGCLADLGGVSEEILTDRDPALVIGESPEHRPVFAPQWIDLCATLGVRPRACRPYRAKTKGKVERVIRELKEDFLRWLTGQILPSRPSLGDYDRLVRSWCEQVVASRRHRTTGRVVVEAWAEERQLLQPLPDRLRAQTEGHDVPAAVIDLAALRSSGAVVEAPILAEYEAVLG